MNTMALIYDFDGTLVPGSMQDHTIIPKLKMQPDDFWAEVDAEKKRTGGDSTLTYMRMILQICGRSGVTVSEGYLKSLAGSMKFFPGVDGWFDRAGGLFPGMRTAHYVVSSGLRELIEHCAIGDKFDNIFASEYFYGNDGAAVFPKFCVNFMDKVQYIFRINKGMESQLQNINEHVPQEARPVPLSNMIYIGDGLTDVACMKVIKNGGGRALAVYEPGTEGKAAKALAAQGRADMAVEADYTAGGAVELAIAEMVGTVGRYDRAGTVERVR